MNRHWRQYPLEPLSKRATTYLIYSSLVGLFFFGLYPLLNGFTATRIDTLALYTAAELSIPFVPIFVWFYLSMYVVFIAPLFLLNSAELKRLALELIIVTVIGAMIFFLFPAHLGFTRQLPDSPFYRAIFETLFLLDKPHNLVPSLHVAYSATIIMAIKHNCRYQLKCLFSLWLLGLMLSTLFTHQHHLLDVFTGGLLSLLVHTVIGRCYAKNDCSITAAV